MNFGLFYNNFLVVLKGYSNVSWITSASDNKLNSGRVFILKGSVVSWASKKQTCITHSTMEFEFITLAAVRRPYVWEICYWTLNCGHNWCYLSLYTMIVKQLYLKYLVKFTMKNLDISAWDINI